MGGDSLPAVMGRVWAIVVAAGSGQRFGGPKQYRPLAGRRVLDWSLEVAAAAADGVVLVVPPTELARPEPVATTVVAGAATRSGSVRAGLAAVPAAAEVVVVHDAARPLAGAELFRAVVEAVEAGADAAVPGVPVVDTLRRQEGGVVDRDGLVSVQTPHESGGEATDDATLVEAAGGKVVVVPGSPANLKITRPDDLVVAEALLDAR